MKSILLPLSFFATIATSVLAVDTYPISNKIPGGLTREETPMFVCFGWDDNGYTDGVVWSDTLFKNKVNKDGSPARSTYFITAGFVSDHFREVGDQTPESLKNSWKSLYKNGHEIANHTFSHPNGGTKQAGDGSAGKNFSKEQWLTEMKQCNDSLSALLGIKQSEIKGFRTPYLGVNQGDFDAQKEMGINYDCSIEYGYGQGWDDHTEPGGSYWNSTADAKTRAKLYWPFTLENGHIPGNQYAPSFLAPGQWIFTVYTYLKPSGGEVTGFDGNMWTSGFDKATFVNTLLYNFKLQREGNKCPITINTHTDNYSADNADANSGQYAYKENWKLRREAIEEFLDSILQYPDVRVVPYVNVIDWIKNPVKSSEYVAPTKSDGTVGISDQIRTKPLAPMTARLTSTELVLKMPISGNASVRLINASGKILSELYTGMIPAGEKSISLEGKALSSGVYFVQVNGAFSGISKVVLK